MKIALCGPVDLHGLASHHNVSLEGVPAGVGATPVAPLIIELLERGHQVTLYTLSHDIKEEMYFEWGGLRIFVGPSLAFGAVRNLYSNERSYLKRVISQDKPAFVHSHWTYEYTLGVLQAGVPVLVTIHDLPWNVLRSFRDRCRTVRLGMAYVVAARAHQFTAVSEDAAQHFRRYMRRGAKVDVIPNFIPKLVLRSANGPCKHPGRPLVYATVLQGWTRQKNPTVALRAFAQVRRASPDSQLLMIGTDYGPCGPAEVWAQSQGYSESVTFLGRMAYSAMIDLLKSRVDAIVIPSLDESFSMVALEGMTLGKPVIAGARTPGVRDVLGRGAAGILVDISNPSDVAHAMLRLEEDVLLYAELSRQGYARALSTYGADGVVAAYETLYQGIVAS